MDHTTVMIIGLCSVGLAAWVMLCWSAERFFRVFVAVSVVLHAGLFFIPFATGKIGPQDVTGERLLPLTVVQGVGEPAIEVAIGEVPDEETIEGVPGPDEDPIVETAAADAVVPQPEKPDPAGIVDAGLPKIEAAVLISFDEHPGAASYRRELQRTIQRYFEVPPELEAEGYEGRVKVWITLGRDGTVRAVELDPTMRSENPQINQLTLDNLWKISNKIPPLPGNVKDDIVPFNVILDYRIFRNR
ncbi:MAG: TonB C-terminal domain-containing protein [Verrucomicrobia bacterium]|nr:TonB C-terminal domain-containing protein [Verrucomicrobiota bacterium]